GLVANVPGFSAFKQYLKPGMVQQFSLGFQHDLQGGVILEAGYVGTRGKDIDANEPINTPAPGPGVVQTRRPNVKFSAINLFGPAVMSQYDGLQLRAQKRLSKGLQLLLSYTYSRTLDNACTPQDPNNPRAQCVPSNFDRPSQLPASYAYHLPC